MSKFIESKPEQERRFRIALLPEHVLLELLVPLAAEYGMCINKLSIEDVPAGTQVLNRWYDASLQMECYLLYNPDWPSVPEGEYVPKFQPKVTVVRVNLEAARLPEHCTQPLSGQPNLATEDPAYDKYKQEAWTHGCAAMSYVDWKAEKGFEVAWFPPVPNSKEERDGSARLTARQAEYLRYRTERRAMFQMDTWWCLSYEAWVDEFKPDATSSVHRNFAEGGARSKAFIKGNPDEPYTPTLDRRQVPVEWEPPLPGSVMEIETFQNGTDDQRQFLYYRKARQELFPEDKTWWCLRVSAWRKHGRPAANSTVHGRLGNEHFLIYPRGDYPFNKEKFPHLAALCDRGQVVEAKAKMEGDAEFVAERWAKDTLAILEGERITNHDFVNPTVKVPIATRKTHKRNPDGSVTDTFQITFPKDKPKIKGYGVHADGSIEFFDTSLGEPHAEKRPWAWQAGLPNPENPPQVPMAAKSKGYSELLTPEDIRDLEKVGEQLVEDTLVGIFGEPTEPSPEEREMERRVRAFNNRVTRPGELSNEQLASRIKVPPGGVTAEDQGRPSPFDKDWSKEPEKEKEKTWRELPPML
jgi:hypothetical protein